MRAATQAPPKRELPKRELPSRDRKGAVLAARALLTRAATAAEYKDGYADSNGVKTHYVTTGTGLRGYNLSDKPAGEENYDMRLLIGDVAAVIKHLGREKALTALLAPALNNSWDWLDADLTLVTIPNASHFVQQDASELVSISIKSGLNR